MQYVGLKSLSIMSNYSEEIWKLKLLAKQRISEFLLEGVYGKCGILNGNEISWYEFEGEDCSITTFALPTTLHMLLS